MAEEFFVSCVILTTVWENLLKWAGAMKLKKLIILLLITLFLAGCSGSDLTYVVENNPVFTEGKPTEIVLRAENDEGEAETNLELTGEMQMEKEDYGTLDVEFTNHGDGTYTGSVLMPAAGEWVLKVTTLADGEEDDIVHLIRIDVK